ncbi:MAG: hypothetical protein SH847_10690 [Roseiflexaceae bacterium]|nr:hypothetical protein [Roseiflexaceae bacterium]
MQIKIETAIDDQTAAAIVAALEIMLRADGSHSAAPEPAQSAWAAAGTLAGQGLPGAKGRVTWSTADRIGRAARWSNGILASFHEW